MVELSDIDKSDTSSRLVIGLALGGGSARGWAHLGVIQALSDHGIEPDIICGTSIGALVGGAYAANRLDALTEWVVKLRIRDIVGLYDVRLNGGVIKGKKLFDVMNELITDTPIEALSKPFIAVATRLHNGQETWLRHGPMLSAIRASCAVPGLFMPVYHKGHWLVDGALVNPVPVSACRALGADIVIAVDVNGDLLGQRARKTVTSGSAVSSSTNKANDKPIHKNSLAEKASRAFSFGQSQSEKPSEPDSPSMLEVMAESINIMQERITRSRMAGDPPDIVILPRLSPIGFMEFHRSQDAIAAGTIAVEHMHSVLTELCSCPNDDRVVPLKDGHPR